MRIHHCANDFNVFCSLKISQSSYPSLIKKIQATPGVRKVISFPVIKEIAPGLSVDGVSLLIAIRMPIRHNTEVIQRMIRDSSPRWADKVDGIFSYLVCFGLENKNLESFIRKLSSKHPEYVEPLILLSQIL